MPVEGSCDRAIPARERWRRFAGSVEAAEVVDQIDDVDGDLELALGEVVAGEEGEFSFRISTVLLDYVSYTTIIF